MKLFDISLVSTRHKKLILELEKNLYHYLRVLLISFVKNSHFSGIASGSMMNNNSGPPSYSMSMNRSSGGNGGGFNDFPSGGNSGDFPGDNSLESLNAMEKSLSEQVSSVTKNEVGR